MLIRDLLAENVDIRSLIERVSHAIPMVLHEYIERTLKEWRWAETYGYAKEHGLPTNFDTHETGFYPDDRIGDNLSQLIPINGSSPVYGAMTMLSRALTQIVQQYVGEKFGDPITVQHGAETISVPVKDIRVSVWWHPKKNQSYGGVFRSRSYHANGDETLLEVVVNREFWRQWLLDAFIGYLSGEGYIFDEFQENIINTLAHEYEHLEQNLKGAQNYTFSLLPRGKTGRNSSSVNAASGTISSEDYFFYLARPAEIDAMATGAAAQVVERIMRDMNTQAMRHYNPGWTIQKVSDQAWNEAVKDALARGVDTIPADEFYRYVDTFDQQLANANPVTKSKFLQRVKNRFLKTYYKRLTSYLREPLR